MAKLPFKVERVQTDNGSEFGQAFHWHLLDAGVDHVRIKPRTPRLNGKVERSHRIDSEEFYRLLEGQVIDDTNLFTYPCCRPEDYYNYHRPHGALNGQTPYERLRQKPKTHCHRPSSVAQVLRRLGGCFGVLVLDQARLIMLAALVLCVTGLLELEGGVFDADGAMAGDAGLQVVEQPGAVRRCRFPSGRKVADDPSCTAQLHTSRPRTVRPSRKPRLWGSRPGLNRLPPGAASRTISANRWFVSADG
jgi:hypothetical protein